MGNIVGFLKFEIFIFISMINGAHIIIYSSNPTKDRTFFRDVLKLPNVDVGEGWLIFSLPPSEVAVHPSSSNNLHELYLMCEDIQEFIGKMKALKIKCSAIQNQGWGLLTKLTLPGGGKIGVYQPRHRRPGTMTVRKSKKAATRVKKGASRKATR
jgi:hypothetical protein